jgi:5-methylcytosine-specific restriction endonuclease McrA
MILDWLRSWLSAEADLVAGSRPRSSQWPRVRREHLARYPSCAACGRTRELEVHHVVPYHERPDLELEAGNLLTLCADPCHLVHGHLMSWTRINPRVRQDADAYLSRIREARAAE